MSATIDYGIDLGTTNSSIALCRGGAVRVFQNTDLMNATPSVVYIGRTGRMLVGRKAYDTWVQDPQNTQAEFKRWMGLSDRLTFVASARSMSAEELSAEVLKSLRSNAARQTQEQISAAVITVPAAFGSLQCDATARAAKLAGFEQVPLLQEPVAAAIAYGATPSAKDQRWMVFDLGGGTLDIAVISTRNSRLAVLDHQGDNRLGGKDIDRIIAEAFFIEPLADTFALPDRHIEAAAYDRLLRALIRQAEQAKVSLSTEPQVEVELFGLGQDRDGKTIELSLTLNRADVEARIRPLIERCLALAQRAMEEARLSKKDLDRVLLVGGPTQMPILRAALADGIGATLDYSLDPMTVVAQGAALYASTLERMAAAKEAASIDIAVSGSAKGKAVAIELAYERASGTVQSPVAGTLAPSSGASEVKIDAEGGLWSSGWMALADGRFVVEVMLNANKPTTQFSMSARDRKGREMALEPTEFSIAFMLPMGAPPLPHTIAIELTDHHGRVSYDPVFKRHGPLPAEARRSYKADTTLRPSELEATLPIKFWEIDVSEDPQERWWAGSVNIRADRIKRPIVEGSQIELTIKIDASRKITVEAFIPLLNESFVDGVYIPDPPSARSQLQAQLDQCFDRLDVVRRHIYANDRDDLIERVKQVELRLEAIAEETGRQTQDGAPLDPDAALGPTHALRKIRMQLAQFEEQLETSTESALARTVRAEARWTREVAQEYGNDRDRQETERLATQLDKYVQADDPRGIKWIQEELRQIRGPILEQSPRHWETVFQYLKNPTRRFVNQQEAQKLMAEAEQARAQRNFPELKRVLNRAWELLPPDRAQVAKEQLAQSGLRGI